MIIKDRLYELKNTLYQDDFYNTISNEAVYQYDSVKKKETLTTPLWARKGELFYVIKVTKENFDYKFVVDADELSKEKVKSYKLEEEIDSLKLKIETLKSELKDRQKVIVRNKSNDEIICETTLEENLVPPTYK